MPKVIDGVIGHAIGDALGVPVEFKDREQLSYNPVTEMIGHGTYNVPKGFWSDDTSMEIALIDSIINNEKIDYTDIMNNFANWIIKGEYTPNGIVFDKGNTCLEAILNYINKNIDPLECGLDDYYSNGNGSLMRILPVAYYSYYKNLNNEQIYQLTKNISSLTHRHEISILGCYIYILYTIKLIQGIDKKEAYKQIQKEDYSKFTKESLDKYKRILKEDINNLNINNIKSSGYIVDSLEAALWCILNTDNYKDSVLTAVNLGGDTDTIAAITGSMTGIIYGYKEIPKDWINSLARKDYLEDLSNNLEKVLTK